MFGHRGSRLLLAGQVGKRMHYNSRNESGSLVWVGMKRPPCTSGGMVVVFMKEISSLVALN